MQKLYWISIASIMLASCGGGGGNSYSERQTYDESNRHHGTQTDNSNSASNPDKPTPPPIQDEKMAGFYSGQTDNNLTLDLLVLDNGSYWGSYAIMGSLDPLGGVLHGDFTVKGDQITSDNFKNFSIQTHSLYSGTISATVKTNQTLNGSLQYSPSNHVTFKTDYQATSFSPEQFDQLEGEYTGQLGLLGKTDNATILIGKPKATANPNINTRRISGETTSGCQIEGDLNLTTNQNYFDVAIDFVGTPCLLAQQNLTGILLYQPNTTSLKMLTINKEGNNSAMLVATAANNDQ